MAMGQRREHPRVKQAPTQSRGASAAPGSDTQGRWRYPGASTCHHSPDTNGEKETRRWTPTAHGSHRLAKGTPKASRCNAAPARALLHPGAACQAVLKLPGLFSGVCARVQSPTQTETATSGKERGSGGLGGQVTELMGPVRSTAPHLLQGPAGSKVQPLSTPVDRLPRHAATHVCCSVAPEVDVFPCCKAAVLLLPRAGLNARPL